MRVKLNYFVLCENAVLGDRNRVSLINIYDRIYASSVPAMHGRMFLVVNLLLTSVGEKDKKVLFSLSLKSPSGKELIENSLDLEKEVNTKIETQKFGNIFEVNGVIFTEFGIYEAILSVNNDKLASLSFEVAKSPN